MSQRPRPESQRTGESPMRSDLSLPKAFLTAAIFCGASQSQTQPTTPPPKPRVVAPRAPAAAPPARAVPAAAAMPPGPVVRVRPRVAMPIYVPPPVFVAPVYVAPLYVPPPVVFVAPAFNPPNVSSGFGEDAGLVAPPDVPDMSFTDRSNPEPVARPEVQTPPAESWPAAMAPEQPPSFQDLASDWKKPGPDYVFLPGYFFYDGSFVWVKGHWELPPFAGAQWVPYRWTQTPSGWWALHKGYWQ